MAEPRLTPREHDVLAALDCICWEDSDTGGDGWARVGAVAAAMKLSSNWTYQRLQVLVMKGLVERSHRPGLHFALTEQGAELLAARDPQEGS